SEALLAASGATEDDATAVPLLLRPPYGAVTPEVLDWLVDLDRTMVFWDVAPDDWSMPGADTIARIVLEQIAPGSVVLLHDGGGDRSQTVAALPVIIEGLLDRGFGFVRVDDLLRRPSEPTPSGAS